MQESQKEINKKQVSEIKQQKMTTKRDNNQRKEKWKDESK